MVREEDGQSSTAMDGRQSCHQPGPCLPLTTFAVHAEQLCVTDTVCTSSIYPAFSVDKMLREGI